MADIFERHGFLGWQVSEMTLEQWLDQVDNLSLVLTGKHLLEINDEVSDLEFEDWFAEECQPSYAFREIFLRTSRNQIDYPDLWQELVEEA